MKKRNIFIIAGIVLIALITLVLAADFTPQGNINLRSVYNITGAVYIFADSFNGSGEFITGIPTYNVTYDNFMNNESNLNVNSSDYWNNLSNINATQMEDNSGVLNILESWLNSVINTLLNPASTNLQSNISAVNTSLIARFDTFNYNQSGIYYYNQTYTGGTYNVTYNASIIWAYNQSDGSYNVTYEAGANSSWNEARANNLYAGIEWDYNQSDGSYNSTYADYITLNSTNTSLYWDNMNIINATQMEDNSGVLNILVTWLETFFDNLFGGKTTDDLSQGAANYYDNQSWNQSLADGLYASSGAGNSSFNQTLTETLYANIKWGYNQSDGSYNSTYDAKVTFPGYTNIAMTNITETFTEDVIFNKNLNFSGGGYIYDNGTALILGHT